MAMKRILWRIGLIAGIAATVAFAWHAARVFEAHDLALFASGKGMAALLAAAACYSAMIPLSALGWQVLLRGFDVTLKFRTLVEILAIAQFAKYLPGNVGVHLGRAGMVATHGVGGRAIVGSLLTEMMLAVVAALGVGAFGLWLTRSGILDILRVHAGRSLTLAGVFLASAVLAWLVLWRIPGPARTWMTRQSWPGWRPMLRATFLYALNYALIALGILIMAHLLLPGTRHDFPLLLTAFPLAWVAGFFAPGAPAGLGIRETLMLLILRTGYAEADALVIVVGARVATILGDVAAFLTGSLSLLLSRRAAASS
jgi:glycosyltransferase 2 family protein